MASGKVVELNHKGRWARALAEGHLDRLQSRANWARVRAGALSRQIDVLARQFAEDDLVVRSGPRQGEKLGSAGRQARLKRLAMLHRAYWQAMDTEAHLRAILGSLERPGSHAEKSGPESKEEAAPEEIKRRVLSLLGVSTSTEREAD